MEKSGTYNKVIQKFGYPTTIIKEFENWHWLLRPVQVTLGSSILIVNDDYRSFGNLPQESYVELRKIVSIIEKALKEAFNFDKINYLMLMMKDPIVHFHIIPRYSENKIILNKKFVDDGYPGPPDLQRQKDTEAILLETIRKIIISNIK